MWWDYVPEASQTQVLNELQRWEQGISSTCGGQVTSVGEEIGTRVAESSKSFSEISSEMPQERNPRSIAMWVAGLTNAFAISIAAANMVRVGGAMDLCFWKRVYYARTAPPAFQIYRHIRRLG